MEEQIDNNIDKKSTSPVSDIFGYVTVGIYIRTFDGKDFKYQYFNERAREFYDNEIFTDSENWNQKKEDSLDMKCINSRQGVSYEKAIKDKKGNVVRWLEVNKINNIQCNISYITTTLIDITQRKRGFEDLIAKQEKMKTTTARESAFFSNIGREIRTPLNAILGFSQLLVDAEEAEERKNYHKIIVDNADFLSHLFNNLLDISQLESDSFNLVNIEFDLSNFFDSIEGLYKHKEIHNGVSICFKNPYKECTIRFDKNRLTQVVTKFLDNAIKYTHKGEIVAEYKVDGSGFYMSFKDPGEGIDPDKMKALFDRFDETHAYSSPTVLSLAINKGIIDNAGGRLDVTSTKGYGTTFSFFIPCAIIKVVQKE